MTKVYVAIDPAWSYGFLGGVKEFLPMHLDLIDDLYDLAFTYVRAQHNFLLDREAKVFNAVNEHIVKRLQKFNVHPSFFEHQFKALYLHHRVGLDALGAKIQKVQCINNDLGDVIGIVCDI